MPWLRLLSDSSSQRQNPDTEVNAGDFYLIMGHVISCYGWDIPSFRYLALAGHLVLGKENPGNMSKRLEQFLARIIRIELNYRN